MKFYFYNTVYLTVVLPLFILCAVLFIPVVIISCISKKNLGYEENNKILFITWVDKLF